MNKRKEIEERLAKHHDALKGETNKTVISKLMREINKGLEEWAELDEDKEKELLTLT